MSQTLYRKYRPKKFEEVSGQEHIIQNLLNQIKSGKVAQAYLFTGPRGVGKTTTARLFAAAVNGAGAADEEIMEGRDLDVIEIDAASNSRVDDVREYIIENARLTPNRRPYKIFIIDEVHMMSNSAFNALLKLIEEPPKHVLFVLATTELHKVPATIISRCQRFDFRKLSTPQIILRLKDLAGREKVAVEDSVLTTIAKRADGSLRDAESILGQVLALGGDNITAEQASLVLPSSLDTEALALLASLADVDAAKAFGLLNAMAEQGADLNQFTQDFLAMAREVMICQHGLPNNLADQYASQVAELAKRFTPAQTVRIIESFAEQRLHLKNSPLPQLPLELAVIKSLQASEPILAASQAAPVAQVARVVPVAAQQPYVSAPKKEVIDEKPQAPAADQEKKTLIEPVRPPQYALGAVLIENIKQDWSKFLSLLQRENASLVLILKTVEPLRIDGDNLVIGFKYPFHKERINSHDSRKVLEEKLAQYFNASLKVVGEVLAGDYQSAFIESQTRGDDVELVSDTSSGQNSTLFLEDRPVETPAMTQDTLIQNLIKAFGGRVVE